MRKQIQLLNYCELICNKIKHNVLVQIIDNNYSNSQILRKKIFLKTMLLQQNKIYEK